MIKAFFTLLIIMLLLFPEVTVHPGIFTTSLYHRMTHYYTGTFYDSETGKPVSPLIYGLLGKDNDWKVNRSEPYYICGNFSKDVIIKLQTKGIECFEVVGELSDNQSIHSWVVCKDKGQIYEFDPTGMGLPVKRGLLYRTIWLGGIYKPYLLNKFDENGTQSLVTEYRKSVYDSESNKWMHPYNFDGYEKYFN